MDTWSNTCRKCDSCGVRYAPRQNISYKHRDFCSFKCKEDFIDADNAVNGTSEPDLFDWRLSATQIDP